MAYSKELCGGTHVKNTGEIEKFAILSIESKGSGIFRIEGATKDYIIPAIKEKLKPIIENLKVLEEKRQSFVKKAKEANFDITSSCIILPRLIGSYQDIINYREKEIEARNEVKELEHQYESMYRSEKSSNYQTFLNYVEDINGVNTIITKVNDLETDIVKDIVDKLSANFDNCLIFIANIVSDKVVFIAKSKGNNNRCGDLVKAAALITGGNGGGRPDFAQAGGKDISKVDEALLKVKELIK